MIPPSPSDVNLASNPLFRRGVALFNQREFYECHEVLEDLWRVSVSPRRIFIQAVIHFAVAFHHHQQGNTRGAQGQLRKGLRKMAGYPGEYQGVRAAELYRAGQRCLELIQNGSGISDFPVIELEQMCANRPDG